MQLHKIVAETVQVPNPGTTGGLLGMRPETLQLALRSNFAMDVLHAVVEAGANAEWHGSLIRLMQLMPLAPLRKRELPDSTKAPSTSEKAASAQGGSDR